MNVQIVLTLFNVCIYLIGLAIGFKLGREYERYKNKDKWDQDAR